MLLLDTHVILWFDQRSSRLGRRSKSAIQTAIHNETCFVPAVAFFEIGYGMEKRRIRLGDTVARFRLRLLDLGINEIPLDGAIAVDAAELTWNHRDPVDRFIVATARVNSLKLVTADTIILDWTGKVARLDATS